MATFILLVIIIYQKYFNWEIIIVLFKLCFLEFCVCRFTCIYIQLKEPHTYLVKDSEKKNGQSNVSCIALNEKNNLIVYGQEVQIYFINNLS